MNIISILISLLLSVGVSVNVRPNVPSADSPKATTIETTETTDSGHTIAKPGIMNTEAIAKCLGDKGVTFYGAYWCPHCQKQKEMFGDSMTYIKYVECDPKGPNGDPKQCDDAGVEAFPTWIFPNGPKEVGTQDLQKLARLAGCTS